MSWIWISLLAYFFLAVASALDKVLLKKRIPKPSVFAFYVAILGFGSFVLAPFGFFWIGINWFLLSLFAGTLFVYAILVSYYAVKKNEISRVTPLVLSFIQITTFLIAVFFSLEVFDVEKLAGFFLLLFGGFFISFDLPIKSLRMFSGFRASLLSGILFGISYSLFGYIYAENGFVSGFIWTRMGLVAGGFSLFLFPTFRREIWSSLRAKKKRKKAKHSAWFTVFIFFADKASSSVGSVLMNYAFAIGSVAYIQAMGSAQFVFVLILASLASLKRPDIFEEKLFFWDWVQKIVSILIIGAGVALISL